MKLNDIDLNKIHVFCSVVRNHGYRGASEELHLTRSALSQAIGNLETGLGVPLFQRVGRRLVPTPAALQFYNEVRGYQDRLQDSVATLIGAEGRAEGVLRIGAYLEFAKSKLMPVVEEFLTRNPKAQLKFLFDSPSRLESLLEARKIDLAISVFPHRGKHAIVSRKLYQEELVLVGAPNLISERPRPAHFQDVPVIDYFQSHLVFKRWWALHFGGGRYRGPVRAYAATADMVLELAKRGLGVGVVPRYILENMDATKTVHVIQPTSRQLFDYLWVNESRGAKKSLVLRSFEALLDARVGMSDAQAL